MTRPLFPGLFVPNYTATMQWNDNDNVTVTLVDVEVQWLRSYIDATSFREATWATESGSKVFFRVPSLINRAFIRTVSPLPSGNRPGTSALYYPTLFLPEDQRQFLIFDWFSWADPADPEDKIISYCVTTEATLGGFIWTDFP